MVCHNFDFRKLNLLELDKTIEPDKQQHNNHTIDRHMLVNSENHILISQKIDTF